MAKGLWKFVDGSAILAKEAVEDSRETKLKAEQQKAFSTNVMSVSSSLLYLITSCCPKMLGIPSRNTLSMAVWQTYCSLRSNTFAKK